MSLIEKRLPLPNALEKGSSIPVIGLGTWQSGPGEVAAAVKYAIKDVGYRHIDGAWMYGNENEVGRGIKDSGIPRSEIFVTSKVWGTFHRKVDKNVDEILKSLDMDYVDLLLIHWPVPLNGEGNDPKLPTRKDGSRDVDEDWKIEDTWRQMEAVQKSGKARHIGVSNFSEKYLERIFAVAEIKPVVNQLELHAYLPQPQLLKYLTEHGIVAEAYSPLGSVNSPLLKEEAVLSVAKKHNVDAAAVLLGFLIAKDIVVLPKSVTQSRIASNAKAAVLDTEDVKQLDELTTKHGKGRRFIKPKWGVDLGFADWN